MVGLCYFSDRTYATEYICKIYATEYSRNISYATEY